MKKNYAADMPIMDERFRLARAYVRFQTMEKIFEPQKALMRGTIFPELYEPYSKKKRSESGDD